MNSYDVIVVGAGPSGTISSYTLARLGFKVLLVDKERFPRYKPCGGALTLKTVRLLKHEGLFDDNMVESTNRF
ncbi:MAG: FAD-dependent monooxygenase, partial [Desulfurococcaceae archaeon]